MTWRSFAGRCAAGFAIGNVVSFVERAIGDALVFRPRRAK